MFLSISPHYLAFGRFDSGTGRIGCCYCALLTIATASPLQGKTTNGSSISLTPVSTTGHHSCSFLSRILLTKEPSSGCAQRKIDTSKLLSLLISVGLFSSGPLSKHQRNFTRVVIMMQLTDEAHAHLKLLVHLLLS